MAAAFRRPDFGKRQLELRCEDGEVCIYATAGGLEKLMAFCKQLLGSPGMGHIHLEDYEVLTRDSLPGVLAVFGPEGEAPRE